MFVFGDVLGIRGNVTTTGHFDEFTAECLRVSRSNNTAFFGDTDMPREAGGIPAVHGFELQHGGSDPCGLGERHRDGISRSNPAVSGPNRGIDLGQGQVPIRGIDRTERLAQPPGREWRPSKPRGCSSKKKSLAEHESREGRWMHDFCRPPKAGRSFFVSGAKAGSRNERVAIRSNATCRCRFRPARIANVRVEYVGQPGRLPAPFSPPS